MYTTLFLTFQKSVQETAKEIAGKGGTAFAYKCDVSSSDDVKQTASRLRQNLDHVDIVVRGKKTTPHSITGQAGFRISVGH